jgi:hypothetical protein
MTQQEKARLIVDTMLTELFSRFGFRQEWNHTPLCIQTELRETLVQKVLSTIDKLDTFVP